MRPSSVNFIYKGQIYSVALNLLRTHSDHDFEHDCEIHYLVSEFEGDINLTEEIILSFIDFFQSEEINISTNNVLQIHYLSNKYQISKLIKLTSEFLAEHKQDIFNTIFTTKMINSKEQEDFISNNLLYFIDDDRLLNLEVIQIYRIIDKYYKMKIKDNNVISEQEEQKFITFIFKMIEKKGEEATILLSLFELSKNGRKFLNEELHNHSNFLNFNYVVSNAIFRLIDIDEINKNQQEQIDKLTKQFKEEQEKNASLQLKFKQEQEEQNSAFQTKIDSLTNQFKKEQEKQESIINKKINSLKNQFKQEQEEQNSTFQTKIDLFNQKFEQKYQELENRFQNKIKSLEDRIEQLNKTIFEFNSYAYFRVKNDYETFNNLKGESQLMIILGLQDPKYNNKNIQNIPNLLKFLSKEQTKSKYEFNEIKYIEIETNNSKNKLFDNDEKQTLILPIDALKMLNKNQSIKSQGLIDIINNFEEIHARIPLPSENNSKILSVIVDIKKSTDFNIIVDIIITKINENSRTLQNNKYINTVTIEPTVKVIKQNFFEGCSLLSKVEIPSTVTQICERSFKDCLNLQEITIPTSVAVIGEGSFENCKSLNKITIQSKLTTISNNLFKGCSSLTEITIPSSVKTICNSSFEGCSSLIQISIPSSVDSIGTNSFKECLSLKEITIPPSVKTICDYSFKGCSSLKEITIPSSVKEIGEGSFENCTSLEKIVNDSSILSINNNLFKGCSSLKEITIPSSVKTICVNSFKGCTSLKEITIPSSVKKLEVNVFMDVKT